jgi:transposase-like protein
MDNTRKKIIHYAYIDKESYLNIHPVLIYLKEQGLTPKAITLDGHIKVTRAMRDIWPAIIIQRCLYHIQRQGLSWLRTYPKTEAGRALRILLNSVIGIKVLTDKKVFLINYTNWHNKYKDFIKTLPRNSVANIDLKRAVALINNALPNMFHYLKDRNIATTTNLLEGFYSQLKHHYRGHRGLTEKHKIAYLKWYCYFKNMVK